MNRSRRASKDSLVPRVLACRQCLYNPTTVVVDAPLAEDAVHFDLIPDAKAEARTDG